MFIDARSRAIMGWSLSLRPSAAATPGRLVLSGHGAEVDAIPATDLAGKKPGGFGLQNLRSIIYIRCAVGSSGTGLPFAA
jgi:hypothetical protein